MTILLVLDTEQADLVKAANDMMHAAMDARARRMDPDDIVSKTAKMSRAKCESVIAQLHLGPLLDWPDLSRDRALQILTLCKVLYETENETEKATIYSGLRTLILQRDYHPELPWHTPNLETQDLRGSAVEGDNGEPQEKPSRVRKRMRSQGD